MCYGLRNAALKFVFYGLVIAIWVAAAAFIVIGSILAADNPTIEYGAIFEGDFHTEVWDTSIYMTITLGCIIAGIAFAGFCGVRRESTFLLFLFAVSMIVFVMLELAMVIMSGTFKDDVKDNIGRTMVDQLQNDYIDETSGDSLSKDWNKMQQDLKCCGSLYYPDYYVFNSQFYQTTGNVVPYSCCAGEEDNYDICLQEATRNISTFDILYYRNGCAFEMFTFVEDQMAMIVATLAITMGVQLCAIIIGCLLRDNYKNFVRK